MIILGVLTILFFLLEISMGLFTGSMALVADSFHMLSDLAALIVAYVAIQLSRKKGEVEGYTYGYKRAEILGAFTNGIILMSLSFTIILNSTQRFFDPEFIKNPLIVLIVGCLGLCMNLFGMFLFMGGGDEGEGGGHSHGGHSHGGGHGGHGHGGHGHGKKKHKEDDEKHLHDHSDDSSDDSHSSHSGHSSDSSHDSHSSHSSGSSSSDDSHSSHGHGKKGGHGGHGGHSHGGGGGHSHGGHSHGGNMNFRGIFLHAMSDAIGNFGVIISSLIVLLAQGDWRKYLDPAASVIISIVVMNSALPLIRSSASLLMQGVPEGIDSDKVRRKLLEVPGVVDVPTLRIWGLSEETNVAGVHVVVRNTTRDYPRDRPDSFQLQQSDSPNPFRETVGTTRSNTTLGRLGGGGGSEPPAYGAPGGPSRTATLRSVASSRSTSSRSLHSSVTHADGTAVLSVMDVQHYVTVVTRLMRSKFDIEDATVQVTMESEGDSYRRVARMKTEDVHNVVLPFLFSILQPVDAPNRRQSVRVFHSMVSSAYPREWEKMKHWMRDSLTEEDYDKLVDKMPHIEEL
ncbi:hypothetical protein HK405_011716 [Cladochytrium tenue]|nr:hypothetical protein HK405_011716 [Cladochytrium tenue]